jgi:hypothetical protein
MAERRIQCLGGTSDRRWKLDGRRFWKSFVDEERTAPGN